MAKKPPAVDDPRIPDFLGAFRAWRAQRDDRGSWDPTRLHVSDLAQCPAMVAARRRGEPMLPPTAEQVVAMEQGIAFEALVHRFFQECGPEAQVFYQKRVWLWIEYGGSLGAAAHDPGGVVVASTVTGTADFVVVLSIDGMRFCLVIDTKWLGAEERTAKRKTKDPTSERTITEAPVVLGEPQYEHRVQVASYGLAFGAEYAGIWRGGRALQIDWERVEPWRPQITALVKQQLSLTDPNALAPPPAVPPTWGGWNDEHTIALHCYRCPWGGCVENKSPQRDLQEELV
jgi:hypothetical protein